MAKNPHWVGRRDETRPAGNRVDTISDDGPPTEVSPLLAAANGVSDRRPTAQTNHATTDASQAGWKQFLLDSQRTPGRDNENIAVRWGATVWHITKVTLLSSKLDSVPSP
jgi:hypothetical protein